MGVKEDSCPTGGSFKRVLKRTPTGGSSATSGSFRRILKRTSAPQVGVSGGGW